MFSSLHNEMTEALASLRADQEKIAAALGKLGEVTASATTRDRTIRATVDGQGRLVELDLKGQKWREMAPKELGAKIVEVVTEAQQQASGATVELMAGLTPTGVDLERLRVDGPDLEAMIASAIEDSGRWSR
jgi:hypothetical protein